MIEGPAPETEKPVNPEPAKPGPAPALLERGMLAALFAGLLLGGIYFYSIQNLPLAVASGAAMLFLFRYCRSRQACLLAPPEETGFYKFLALASVLMLAFRFYRIFTFPHDFFADELNDIVDTYAKIMGHKNFFSFAQRQGAAMPLVPEILYSVIMAVFGHRIEIFRAVPALLCAATAAELYFLGKLIKGRGLGLSFLFLYSCSAWTLFASREFIANAFIPFFAVTFLLCFFQHLKTGRNKFFLLACGIFFAGFFTYASWILMAPFAAYLFYEYREELGVKKFRQSVAFLSISTVIAVTAYISNGNMIQWSFSRTDLAGNYDVSLAARILENSVRAWKFFLLPVADGQWFTDRIALLSFTEAVLLAAGAGLCALKIKERQYRVFLAGFIISLFTLLVSGFNHPRHILALPFIVIISGFFLEKFQKLRAAALVTAVLILSFVNAALFMFVDWNRQLRTDTRDRELAAYINRNYSGADTVLFSPSIPLTPLIGDYSLFMHSSPAYKKPGKDRVTRAVFTSSSLFRYYIKAIFPEIKTKYFYDYNAKNRLPLVLYEMDVARSAPLRNFFMQAARQVGETNLLFWSLDYAETIKKCEEYAMAAPGNPLATLKNTFLRYTQLKALEIEGSNTEIARVLFDTEKPMFMTADWALRIAEAAYASGNIKDALKFAKTASDLAPEWREPIRAFETMAANAGIKPGK